MQIFTEGEYENVCNGLYEDTCDILKTFIRKVMCLRKLCLQ